MRIKTAVTTAAVMLCAFAPYLQALSRQSTDNFQAMCIIQVNGQQLMETCNVTEFRDGQWCKGMRVVAPFHNYEMREGTLNGCPKNASTWDTVSRKCYSYLWTSEALPGNEGKSCPEKDGWVTPCGLMTSDKQMIRVTPHLLVQGLTFG